MSDPTEEDFQGRVYDTTEPPGKHTPDTEKLWDKCFDAKAVALARSFNPLKCRILSEDNPFDAELIKMLDIFRAKNADYSGSDQKDPLKNFKSAAELGVDPFVGILIRMSDKWMRIQNLTRTGKQSVKDEALEDTLRDLANYAILAIMAMKDAKKEGGK